MTPEERAAIEANIRKIVEQGGGESDVMAYLKLEGFESREAWLAAIEPVPAGPTEQPPFPTLPPVVGGTLDALVSFGNAVGGGLPARLSRDTRDYLAESETRSPGGARAADVAAGVTYAGLGGAAMDRVLKAKEAARVAARSRELNETARYIRPPSSIPPRPVPQAATPIRDLLKNKWFKRTALGGLGLDYLYNRVLGR